jgi:hypothetical protein
MFDHRTNRTTTKSRIPPGASGLRTYLSHDALRTPSQRFPDQIAQADLSGSLQFGLPGLRPDHVRQRQLQLVAYVLEQRRAWGKPIPEVAAWSGEGMQNGRLSVTGGTIWCHWLKEDAYTSVRDDTGYNVAES